MRNNQPVTQQEYEFPASQMLVSATDLTGRIEYCNPAFIAVSDYTKDELIGQPHNLIRHPDMLREAFADMWTTIRSGHPWTALVKNRRKNGDHYWVRASVTPVVEKGAVVGYLSVRVKPSREAVRAADALYAGIREGKSRSHKLHRGAVVRTGLAGRLQAMMRLPVATRAAFGYALAPLALLLTGLAAWSGMPPLAFWIAFGVTALISVVSWQLLARHLAEPMRDMSGFATRLAAGDLTTDLVIARHDDLGDVLQALNQLKANLAAIVSDVRALDLAKDAQGAAAVGGTIAGQVEQTMAGITAASRRIADITGVIDGIAFQTNILALNAAVEATRAGEAGRSFAVVAGEVRTLAQRCAASSKEIKSVVEASVTEIAQGTELVARTTAQMRVIDKAVSRVSSIIVEAANASSEQADVLDEAVRLFTVAEAVPDFATRSSKNAAPARHAESLEPTLV